MRQNLTRPADSDSKITFNARFNIFPAFPKSENQSENRAKAQQRTARMERISKCQAYGIDFYQVIVYEHDGKGGRKSRGDL
ncbi:hypothetical protein QE152_g28502 [Popillia japonica]|uniref:Uncharacterized protein n=1 Tax=Popillia japonica TaxID=7064 RepID=A0AAW1JJ91_POPJA